MSISCKETECLVVWKKEPKRGTLKVKEQTIKQVTTFNNLGSMITDDARCVTEIKRGIFCLRESSFLQVKPHLEKSHFEHEDQIWGQKTVFYDFLKNSTFRVKSEAINRFYG